jgi:hypothetical protein
VALAWNGPVARDQKLRLWLMPPHLNLALAFIRVLFLVTLLLAVFGALAPRERGRDEGRARAALFLVLGAGALAPTTARRTPDASVLGELRTRLTEAPECLPSCVTSPRMRIEASEKGLRIVQELHVAAPVGCRCRARRSSGCRPR